MYQSNVNYYQMLSGYWWIELSNGERFKVYLDKNIPLESNVNAIKFKQIINQDDFKADNTKGYIDREIEFCIIKRIDKTRY